MALNVYELSNHLGNVLAVVSDRKLPQYQGNLGIIAYYEADQLSLKLYDPFGTIAQEWRITGTYRYSFNGKESDSEWDGGGAMFDYGFRIYDPRLGRFLSVDPLAPSYPWYTPYQFAGNMPIACIDLDGLEQSYAIFSRENAETAADYLPKFAEASVMFGFGFMSNYDPGALLDAGIAVMKSGHITMIITGDIEGARRRAEQSLCETVQEAVAVVDYVRMTATSALNGDLYAQGQIVGLVASLVSVPEGRIPTLLKTAKLPKGYGLRLNPKVAGRLNSGIAPDLFQITRTKINKITGEFLEVPISKNGGLDFSGTKYLYQSADPNVSNIVTIKYTGARRGPNGDFAAANKAAGLKSTPEGYTWHHLDDYDPKTNTGTMQLVRSTAHNPGKGAFKHNGGVEQQVKYTGVPYKDYQ